MNGLVSNSAGHRLALLVAILCLGYSMGRADDAAPGPSRVGDYQIAAFRSAGQIGRICLTRSRLTSSAPVSRRGPLKLFLVSKANSTSHLFSEFVLHCHLE